MQCGLPTGSQAGPTVPPAGHLSSRLPSGHSNPGGAWGAGYLGVRRAAARGAHGGPRPGTGCQGEEGHACPDTDGPAGVPSACSPGTHPHTAPEDTPPHSPGDTPRSPGDTPTQPRQPPDKPPLRQEGLALALPRRWLRLLPTSSCLPMTGVPLGPPLWAPPPQTGMRALHLRQPRAERELWVAHPGHTGTDAPRGFFPRAGGVEGSWPCLAVQQSPLAWTVRG